jgi:hypothetical protein
MKNKNIFTVIVILFTLISSCRKDEVKEDSLENALIFNYNGQNREYLFYKPDDLPNITYTQAGDSCFVGQERGKFKVQFFVGSSVVKFPACV